MKILKILGLTLGSFLLFVLLLGFLKPEIHYGHTITVDKSIQEAWAVAQDPDKHAQWLDGYVSEELISGVRNEVGSKYKVIVKPSPEEDEFEMIETIVSKNEFEHIALHFESDFGNFEQKMSFQEQDSKTTIRTESIVKSESYFMKTMFAVMEVFASSFQKQEEKNMDKLKQVIEENATDYFSRTSESIKE